MNYPEPLMSLGTFMSLIVVFCMVVVGVVDLIDTRRSNNDRQ